MTQENLARFEFRNIKRNEAEQTAEVERICFPPNEACTSEMMHLRVEKAPEMFLVAVDKAAGKIAGFINGLATNETVLRDEFFQNADLYDPVGENVMILGVDVLPEYRRIGLASEMMECYKNREIQNGRKRLILTCLESKVAMYRKMGYEDNGISDSSWGGEQWHEMTCELECLAESKCQD